MMHLGAPPRVIQTTVFSAMPEVFRRPRQRSAWGDANKPGQSVDSFIEGPCFDESGNLLVVDIPYGRIFSIAPSGSWSLIVEYDGEPNGLARHPDGRILIADYRKGLLALNTRTGQIDTVLARRNAEGFKGLNDVIVGPSGAIYFTDQGQTGLHDPTGRVFRLKPDGRLDCLLSNGPSPNGLVLNHDETVLFVAMTRDNSVWRVPLLKDGSTAKVGRFCSLFGTSGPDGLALDESGRLFVAHASLGHVFAFASNGECIALFRSCTGPTCTNVTISPPGEAIFITESATGTVMIADLA
ncbi:gluconolactonase [Bosea sp. OK403]|uniref:SMP-30/gluconolactonase/LRE family protein n=1 Tax=Bosea sp. OK403 TaxID=1855286 RepID=UPI0008EC482A|nr:SMP-30/gluconolactonase/LRE family protein [Bosea sp. OK403]SFJ44477.1 gluconolactonase [Bosea sp. OK403]